MNVAPDEIKAVLKILATTPRRIAAASQGLGNARLHFKPDEETWSANELLAHLRACADVWGKSMLAMIAQDQPTLRYVSPRTWIRKTNYPELEFDASFQAFTHQRRELLKSLKALTLKDWSRSATFTGTTSGRHQTVFSYAQRMANHENEHCEQIEALLN